MEASTLYINHRPTQINASSGCLKGLSHCTVNISDHFSRQPNRLINSTYPSLSRDIYLTDRPMQLLSFYSSATSHIKPLRHLSGSSNRLVSLIYSVCHLKQAHQFTSYCFPFCFLMIHSFSLHISFSFFFSFLPFFFPFSSFFPFSFLIFFLILFLYTFSFLCLIIFSFRF